MSSLTNQQANTKSMTGLSNTYSTNIVCDTFQCDQQFTISPGCVISLPANSIPDSALSSNVAFRNQANTFTLANTFNSNVYNNATTVHYSDQRYVSVQGNGTETQIYQNNGGLSLTNINNSQFVAIFSKTSGGVSVKGLDIRNGNQSQLQADVGNTLTLQASATPTISIQAPSGSNDFSIANTAWIISKGYITASALTPYALLAPPSGQTFTGLNNFPTQATSDNSTLASTTAFVKNQGYITASALTPYALLAGPQTFTGNQNFPTPTTADNSTLAATTAFVKNQGYITSGSLSGYALLAPSSTQTFAGTASTNFTNSSIFSAGLQSNNNITLLSIAGGGQTTNIQQNNSGLSITNVNNSCYIQQTTRTSGGANVIGVSCANGNSAYIQGDSGAQISITGTQANIGGTSVPTVTTQPLSTSNTNEIATTAWAKTQLSGYASLNLNNTFNGTNNFTKRLDCRDVSPNYALVIQNTVSTSFGGLIVPATTGAYNNINIANDFCVIGSGPTIETGILTLSTWSAGYCGIRITNSTITQNAPFTCGYLSLPTPITTKTNNQIGYIWSIPGTSFTSWSGFTSFGNVYTLVWDGSGDKTLGVWNVDICIATNTATSMDSGFVLNTTNNFVINTRSAWSSALTGFGVNPAQIVRLSTVLEITNLTTTYYLNFKLNGGSSRSDNTAGSQILFTRIA